MIEGQMTPLELAARILRPDTIRAVSKSPYNLYGWKILDRWAMNTPSKLLQLESQGEVVLLGRLLDQQHLEQAVLMEPHPDLADHEVLQREQIATELQ